MPSGDGITCLKPRSERPSTPGSRSMRPACRSKLPHEVDRSPHMRIWLPSGEKAAERIC